MASGGPVLHSRGFWRSLGLGRIGLERGGEGATNFQGLAFVRPGIGFPGGRRPRWVLQSDLGSNLQGQIPASSLRRCLTIQVKRMRRFLLSVSGFFRGKPEKWTPPNLWAPIPRKKTKKTSPHSRPYRWRPPAGGEPEAGARLDGLCAREFVCGVSPGAFHGHGLFKIQIG